MTVARARGRAMGRAQVTGWRSVAVMNQARVGVALVIPASVRVR